MRVINMLEDFNLLVEASKQIGKWEAFKAYYEKYKELWDRILVGFYRVNLEGIEPTIETVDFEELLERAKKNIDKITHIEELVKGVIKDLGFTTEFELYIGAGLGHINGCSLPGEIPMIYIGLECIGYGMADLEYLIPHEANHMIRSFELKEINLKAFRERVVTEGLGTIYPLLFNKQAIDNETLAKALLIPLEKVKILLENEEELTRKVFEKMEFELSPELMEKYFVYKADQEEPQLVGYFVGMRMVQRLLEKGKDIKKLTVMSVDKIIRTYQETL